MAAMRWLCDEMLGRLARLLRAAGQDTALAAGGAPDSELLEQARGEGRRIVTRDRALAARAGEAAVLLRADGLEAQAAEFARKVRLDWRTRRFTRCMVDNAPLGLASAAQVAAMPVTTQAGPGPFCACPTCGRVYWPGSHVKRLEAQLDKLAAL